MYSLLRNRSVGVVAKRFSILVAMVLLNVAVWLPMARAQAGAQAGDACVAGSMTSLISRQVNSVKVSGDAQAASQAAGVRENEKGIVAAQAAETKRTLQEARRWFEKGAHKGYPPAEVNLAILSLAGWGAAPNAGAALYWLKEAARQDYALAYFDLGILYMRGCGVRQDYREAFSLFQRGADAGDPAAQMNLGYLYDQGFGVTQDRGKAASWYRTAAESGLAQAQYDLADLYARGEGVNRDEHAAFEWFQKAAAQGHSGARVMVGFFYAEGRGTGKDLRAAYMWLSAAALQGDQRGKALLTNLSNQLPVEQLEDSTKRAQTLARLENVQSPSRLSFVH
jgi:TPR repeat protein